MEAHNKNPPHFLVVTYPAQGHINPALQFSKRLIRGGALVTFTTSVSAYRRMASKPDTPPGLTFATISDGYENGFRPADGDDTSTYLSKFRQIGSQTLSQILESNNTNNKFTCLVYTLLLPWAADVARRFNVPTALLWIQPATVFDVYYYYFNGYKEAIEECDENDPSWSLKLPNLPFELRSNDLPSFLIPSTSQPYTFALATFEEQMKKLKTQENPTILVNTFEELEFDALKSVQELKLIPVGPLLPTAFIDGRDPLDKAFGGDLFQRSTENDYVAWLDSQEEVGSVIYVSFGSLSVLSRAQMEELGSALIQTQRPFLWVIRDKVKLKPEDEEEEEEEEEELSCMEELKKKGIIVPWCSQVEVLSHPSVGCFVTHCGWNSTLESLTSGVPMVGFPQWTDQTTNSKLVEDVWRCGVRVKKSSQEDGLVKSDEIKRCLEMAMESDEIKENARKWRKLAVEAAKEGGSSDMNLKVFINSTFDN